MTLADRLLADAAVLVDPNGIGEAVEYYDDGNLYARRTIHAFVRRNDVTVAGLTGGDHVQHEATVYVLNDPTLGRAAPAKGQDLVDVALTVGETKTRCVVAEIEQQDDGMWALRVTK